MERKGMKEMKINTQSSADGENQILKPIGIYKLKCYGCGKTWLIKDSYIGMSDALRGGWRSRHMHFYCPDCVKAWKQIHTRDGKKLDTAGETATALSMAMLWHSDEG